MGRLLSQFDFMSKSFYQIDQKSYFLCYDATVNKFNPCGTPAGERGKAYPTKRQVSNKVEHRSCVLIIIIGYRRLPRSIFDVQVCDLDIVLKCKALKSRFRRRQRKDNKGDRHSYPDAVEDQKLPILAEKENVPPTGTFVYFTIKKYT